MSIGADEVSLLRDGAQAYPAMLEAIVGARSTICLETYILREDATGNRFAQALCERARAGVEVSVMYDDWGSSVSEEFLSRLRGAGVRTLAFCPVRFSGKLGAILAHLRRRNHRKALVVDGEVGFTGGLNISDDYAAEEDGGQGWRDTHVRIRGPAAAELEWLFLATWRKFRGAPLSESRYARRPTSRGKWVRILGNDFRADRKDIRRAYATAIAGAKRRIHLTHAYFLPPARVVRALQKAARRGVEVSVILAATTDVKLVLYAARALYGKLLRSGVRVFEWTGRVLHAKTAVVDGCWTTVGSANLDALSLRENLEVNAVFEDERLGTAAEAMYNRDLYDCAPVSLEAWRIRPLGERILSWLAFQLRHWL
ncbi:MAG: cardiolipin synthase ClsB [Myxococcales bacterium]|nr:cardiolipin synthase ClsB [Myxococcales bacterium]